MTGHTYALGNFEECVNYNKKLPTPYGQLEGQYCRVNVPLNPSSRDIADSIDLMNRVNENRGSRALKLKLRSGVCFPKSCTIKDLQQVLPFKVSSCKSKEEIPFEALDYVAMYVVLKTLYNTNIEVPLIFLTEPFHQY